MRVSAVRSRAVPVWLCVQLVLHMLCSTSGASRQLTQIFGSNTGESKPSFRPNPQLVEGLIQAGFSRAQAAQALQAVGNENCCEPQMKYLFQITKRKDGEAAEQEKACHRFENTDFDGYAVVWGSANFQTNTADCCQSCKDFVPQPPSFFPCNIWVHCGHKEGCFAPAAGEFKYGQCWLKYQEHPENPHVNMKGAYSSEYRRTHPTAPAMVQWTAGVVVAEGAAMQNGTWSSRSHWR